MVARRSLRRRRERAVLLDRIPAPLRVVLLDELAQHFGDEALHVFPSGRVVSGPAAQHALDVLQLVVAFVNRAGETPSPAPGGLRADAAVVEVVRAYGYWSRKIAGRRCGADAPGRIAYLLQFVGRRPRPAWPPNRLVQAVASCAVRIVRIRLADDVATATYLPTRCAEWGRFVTGLMPGAVVDWQNASAFGRVPRDPLEFLRGLPDDLPHAPLSDLRAAAPGLCDDRGSHA